MRVAANLTAAANGRIGTKTIDAGSIGAAPCTRADWRWELVDGHFYNGMLGSLEKVAGAPDMILPLPSVLRILGEIDHISRSRARLSCGC